MALGQVKRVEIGVSMLKFNRKEIVTLNVLIAVLLILLGASSLSATDHSAADCNVGTIQTLITNAAVGDTIYVPAGNCTWNQTLNVTKAVKIIGAGASNNCPEAGKTCIKSGMVADDTSRYISSQYLLYVYIPTSGRAASYNNELRISGFTFDLDWKSNGLYALHTGYEYTVTYPMNKFRFDNNIMKNIPGSNSSNAKRTGFLTYGEIYGVIHNNTFEGSIYFVGYGSNDNSFYVAGKGVGTSKAIFWEDNQFTHNTTTWLSSREGLMPSNGTAGNSTVHRYNTFTYAVNLNVGYVWEIFQNHGNNTPQTYAGIGYELYGNKIVDPYNIPHRTVDLRGGNNLIFYNQAISTGEHKVNAKEYETNCTGASADFSNPTSHSCPSEPGYLYPTAECEAGNWWSSLCTALWPSGTASDANCKSCTIDGIPQHVWRTYSFNNRYGDGGAGDTLWPFTKQTGYSPERRLVENVQYFNMKSTPAFDGNVSTTTKNGVGCGSADPSTAFPTCTTGAGYWKTTQSCSEIDASLIGASSTYHNPAISGTLYRCSPANTWTPWYTPYAYPHPLRATGGDTQAPEVSGLSPTAEQSCTDATSPNLQDVAISMNTNENATCKVGWNNTNYCADVTQTDADLMCEVPDGTSDGLSGWSKQTTSAGEVDFAYACDNSPALGCSDINTSYCARFRQTSAGTESDLYGYKLLSSGGYTGDLYIQGYLKVLITPTESDGVTPLAYNHDNEIIGVTGDSLPSSYAMNVFLGLTGGYTGSTSHRMSMSVFYLATTGHGGTGSTVCIDQYGGTHCEIEGQTTMSVDTWVGFRLKITNSATADADAVSFWVDWNNDGTFDLVGAATGLTLKNAIKSIYIGQNELSKLYSIQMTGIKVSTTGFPADCRRTTYSTGTSYDNLPYTMSGTERAHTLTATSLACGASTSMFYACRDGSSNTSSTATWAVPVASYGGVTPVITNATLTNQACNVTNSLRVDTSVASTCRYCVNGVGGCTSSTAWASRTPFSSTGGDTFHHDLLISQNCSSSVVYNVICRSTQGNESSNSAITITSDAAKTITAGAGSLSITQGSGSLSVTILP